MKSFRKCIAILLAVSFAAPVDGGPLRERMRANRTRRESRQRVTPEMEKSIAKGIEKAGEPADKPAGEQQSTVAAMGSIGGGTIDPGAPTTLDGLLDVNAGSPSDEDVLTWDAATSSWINAAGGGGSGSTIYTPDGTTTVTRTPTYNVVDYGAGIDYRQAISSGSNTAGTAFNLETGHGAYFNVGNSVVIPGAGTAHQWAAVTPTTPTAMAGGSTTFTGGAAGTDIITLATFPGITSGVAFTRSSNTIVTQHVGVADGHSCYVATTTTLPGGLTAGTEYFLRQVASSTTSYTLHTSRAGALANTGQVTLSSAGSGTHTLHVTMPVAMQTTAADLPAGLSVSTTYYLRANDTPYKFTVHDTAANAAANSGTIDITDAGTGTHSLAWVGAETSTYSIVGFSGAGGYTAPSSAVSVTTCPQTLTLMNYIGICWPPIVDGSSNEVQGYAIYCTRTGGTRTILTRMASASNAYKVTMQAGGYVNCVPTDLGKSGLVAYDNGTREWIIKAGAGNTPSSYPTATLVSISGGAGSGTTTGAASKWYCHLDCGDFESDYDHASMAWRTGHEEQVITCAGTATGGTYSVYYLNYEANVAYNASSSTLEAALRAIPGLSNIEVTARSGSGADQSHTVRFGYDPNGEWGLADVPQLKVRSLQTGGTSPTVTVATTRPGKTYNEGNYILHPYSSSGSLYQVVDASAWQGSSEFAPTISSTLNTLKWIGRGVQVQRVNGLFPVTEPAGAEEDAAFRSITAKPSANTLTLNTATNTTVPDDTPVFRNDLPAWQAAFAAALASGDGNGEIVAPAGRHNWYTRDIAASEWTTYETTGRCLFHYPTGESHNSIGFTLLGNASVFWHPLEVSNFRNNGGIDEENRAFESVFGFGTSHRAFWNGGTFVYAPAAEPLAESSGAQHSVALAREGLSGSIAVTENNGDFHVSGANIYGLPNGLGTAWVDGEVPGMQIYVEKTKLRYGGAGHDAGGVLGNWRSCWVYGTNTRYCSTPCYTNFGNIPVSFYDVHFRQIGVDGIRMRNENFEMIGGSIVFDDRSSCTWPIRFESTAPGGKIRGVYINTPGLPITIDCANIAIDQCDMINTNIQSATASNNLRISKNKMKHNGAVAWTGAPKAIWITAAGDGQLIEGNICRRSANGASSGAGGLAIDGAAGTNVKVIGNIFEGIGGNRGILVSSTFAGRLDSIGNTYNGSDPGGSTGNLFQAANGAVITSVDDTFDCSTKASETSFTGATTARYEFSKATFLNEFSIASITGYCSFDLCNFADATNNADISGTGRIFRNCDFAIAPSATGTATFTSGNTVAGVATTSVALAASQNNYAWPITDTVLFTTTGTNNYSITGVVARAPGSVINPVNVDGTDNITIEHIDGASTATNAFNVNAGVDLVLGPLDGSSFIGTGNATAGWSEN